MRAYHDFLDKNRIMGSKCTGCGKIYLPPRPVCPECGGREMEWVELKGEGAIQAYTVITVPLTRLSDHCPYAVGVVKLDDGPSVTGRILGITDGDEISVGARVKAEFMKKDERSALCFRLA